MEYNISSMQNPRVKDLVHLHERRGRREKALVLVEGYFEILLALKGNARLDCLYYCPDLVKAGETEIFSYCPSHIGKITISLQVLAKLTYREHPDAWVAVFSHFETNLQAFSERITTTEPLLLAMAEDLEKPGNLGAILRSVDAVGAQGFLSVKNRTDLANPNVIRASKGTVFTVPCAECSNEDAYEWLDARGVQILAASPQGNHNFWKVDLRLPSVIVLGTEKEGLSSFWLEKADECVSIPMFGSVNSLNVAQAATIMLYEARRQRSSTI